MTSVHTSRTMMLDDLSLVLAKVGRDARPDAYRSAIIDENILGKPTQTTRLPTAKRRASYSARSSQHAVPLLRHFWSADQTDRPMLALSPRKTSVVARAVLGEVPFEGLDDRHSQTRQNIETFANPHDGCSAVVHWGFLGLARLKLGNGPHAPSPSRFASLQRIGNLTGSTDAIQIAPGRGEDRSNHKRRFDPNKLRGVCLRRVSRDFFPSCEINRWTVTRCNPVAVASDLAVAGLCDPLTCCKARINNRSFGFNSRDEKTKWRFCDCPEEPAEDCGDPAAKVARLPPRVVRKFPAENPANPTHLRPFSSGEA